MGGGQLLALDSTQGYILGIAFLAISVIGFLYGGLVKSNRAAPGALPSHQELNEVQLPAADVETKPAFEQHEMFNHQPAVSGPGEPAPVVPGSKSLADAPQMDGVGQTAFGSGNPFQVGLQE